MQTPSPHQPEVFLTLGDTTLRDRLQQASTVDFLILPTQRVVVVGAGPAFTAGAWRLQTTA